MKEKQYRVSRGGGGQCWFSKPMSQQDALALVVKWKDSNHEVTSEECEVNEPSAGWQVGFYKSKHKHFLAHPNPTIEDVRVEEFKAPTDYADGKERKVTVNSVQFTYATSPQDKVTTIKKNGVEIFKYHGDPHDQERSGVMTAIREYGLL